MATADMVEGTTAFIERRAPQVAQRRRKDRRHQRPLKKLAR